MEPAQIWLGYGFADELCSPPLLSGLICCYYLKYGYEIKDNLLSKIEDPFYACPKLSV